MQKHRQGNQTIMSHEAETIDQLVKIVSSDISQPRHLSLLKVGQKTNFLNNQNNRFEAIVNLISASTARVGEITFVKKYEEICPGITESLVVAENNLKTYIEYLKIDNNLKNYIEYLKFENKILKESGFSKKHEDHVFNLYDHLIKTTSHLLSAIKILRWTIMEKDADLEEPDNTNFITAENTGFMTAEEFIAELNS